MTGDGMIVVVIMGGSIKSAGMTGGDGIGDMIDGIGETIGGIGEMTGGGIEEMTGGGIEEVGGDNTEDKTASANI